METNLRNVVTSQLFGFAGQRGPTNRMPRKLTRTTYEGSVSRKRGREALSKDPNLQDLSVVTFVTMSYFPDTATDSLIREQSRIIKDVANFDKKIMVVLQEYLGPAVQIASDMVADAPQAWQTALFKGHITPQPVQQYIAKLIVAGVPDGFRSYLWLNLLNVSQLKAPGVYESIVTMPPSHTSEQHFQAIAQDVDRTFPKHPYFLETKSSRFKGRQHLTTLLKALVILDKDLGYVSGINYLAAPVEKPKAPTHRRQSTGLLSSTRLALNTGRNILPPRLRDLYPNASSDSESLFELQEYAQVLMKLLDTVDVKLSRHVQKCPQNMLIQGIIEPWFKTVFTAVLPQNHCARIMDMFLLEGVAILFTVAVTLLQHESKHLCSIEPNQSLTTYLSTLADRPVSLPSANSLINSALKIAHPKWFRTWLESRKSLTDLDGRTGSPNPLPPGTQLRVSPSPSPRGTSSPGRFSHHARRVSNISAEAAPNLSIASVSTEEDPTLMNSNH
eukprot:g81539.t1